MKRRHVLMNARMLAGLSGLGLFAGCGNNNLPMAAPSTTSSTSTASMTSTAPPESIGFQWASYITTVLAGSVQQFAATVGGPVGGSAPFAPGVTWSVAGPGCSGTTCGVIDATGKYTAPAAVPNPPTVSIIATSIANSARSDAMTIVIVANAGDSLAFSVSPTNVFFPNQTVNNSSAPKAVTLTNTGSIPQPVHVRIDGLPGAWEAFAQTDNCPSNLAAGASCTISITFTPSATGGYTVYLIVDGFFDEEANGTLAGTGTN